MNSRIEELLNEYGEKIIEAVKKILVEEDKVVTGRTRDSLSFEVEDNVLKVFGAEHLAVIDSAEGRPPSASFDGVGFFDQIKEWASIRGIDEDFHRIIYININRFGWKSDGLNHKIAEKIDAIILELNEEAEEKISEFLSLSIESIFEE